jgi:DHA1 family tetracycline resistance protein-like MFS transporter
MAASALSLANFVFGWFTLRRSLDADHRRAFDWRRANALSSLAVLKGQGRQVLWYVAALGVWQLANVVYPAIWTYFAIAAYGLSTKAVGIALAVVGLTAALFPGVGMRYLLPCWASGARSSSA